LDEVFVYLKMKFNQQIVELLLKEFLHHFLKTIFSRTRYPGKIFEVLIFHFGQNLVGKMSLEPDNPNFLFGIGEFDKFKITYLIHILRVFIFNFDLKFLKELLNFRI
jgi:hypothetical protein